MRKSLLFLAGCYGLAGCLWAGPIYNYTATSASVTGFGPCTNDTFASAPGFSLYNVGGECADSSDLFYVGQQVPLALFPFIENGGATVDFGGFIGGASIGEGLGESIPVQVTTSEGSFTIPPNPDPSYTFTLAARMTGQFTAHANAGRCGTSSTPPCDALAILSIDLPGTLIVRLTSTAIGPPNPQAPYRMFATFGASVPEPSSRGLWLLGAGIGSTVWLARRGKAGRSSC